MANSQLKGAAYGCISAVTYGVNPICAKYLYQDGINANSVLFYRFFFGSLMLGALMLAQRRSFALGRREAAVLFSLGAVFAVSSLSYFVSFYYMPAGVAATLVFAYPVFVAVLMALFFHERLKWPSLSAIALTACGILLLYRGDNGQPIAATGLALILVSALAYALYILIVNKSGIVMSSVKLTFFAMSGCLLCITAFASLSSTGPIMPLHGVREWAMALVLGLLPTVVSLVFMAMAIRCIGSTPTAIMGALEPVTAIVLGMALFGELLTWRMTCGICLILLAVSLIILDSRLRRALGRSHVVRRGRLFLKRVRWR